MAPAQLGAACEGVGFARVRGHGIPRARLEEAVRQARAFFALPRETRLALAPRAFRPASPNGYRGYFPLQPESDTLKEGFEIGCGASGAGGAGVGTSFEEPDVWPPEAALPGFRAFLEALHAELQAVGEGVMESLARHLGLAPAHFRPWFAGSVSTLRLLHYPGGASHPFAAPAHVDSGLVTLLLPADAPGLEVCTREGAWREAAPDPEALTLNLGALLERWSGGRLRATRHRVRRPPRARISIPFFLEPGVDAKLEPVVGLSPPGFETVRYGAHLAARVRAFAEYVGR